MKVVSSILEAQLRKSLGEPLVPVEGPAEHLNNALQILTWTKPCDQSPREVEENILAAEARIMNALRLLEKR